MTQRALQSLRVRQPALGRMVGHDAFPRIVRTLVAAKFLGNASGAVGWHPIGATDVAYGCPPSHSSEGADARHAIGAVGAREVLNDFAPTLVLKIEVDVRRPPLIQEPLKRQA